MLRPAAALLAALAVLAGCGQDPVAAPPPSPTTLAQLEPARMDLVRVTFCDLVPARAITAAVAGRPGAPRKWVNGDRPPLGDAGSDVAHEFGCAWAREDRAARAWVFARPVSAAFGRQVVADGTRRPGCRTTASTDFGDPGLLQVCTTGAVSRVRRAGLFGDSWLTCEVAGPESPAVLTRRADAWCLATAITIDSGR